MSAGTNTTTAYRPVLFIGLGGTGKEILLRLRLRMYERFRTYKVPFARFVWIDTDTRATDARGAELSSGLAGVGFEETEKFALLQGTVGKDLIDIFQNPTHWPHIHEWLYPEVQRFGSEIADGAGGVRAVGRLTFFAKYAGLRDLIERRLNELSRLETIAETQAFFKEHQLPAVNTDGSSAPVVFVVTSVAGGTGCGTFLDMGFLLRDIKRLTSNVAEIFAYAILPNVYNASPQGEIPQRSFANAYAALKELDHFTKRIPSKQSQDAKEDNPYSDFIVSWEGTREQRIEGPPYSATYLIECTNQANLPISQENRPDLFSMLAETLFLDLLPGSFSDAKRSNYSNIVQGLSGAAGANSNRQHVHFTQEFARRYASCGMSKIEIPLDTVRGACASQLATEILDYIARDREDADIGRVVPKDLATARLDKEGIYNNFGTKWKDIITEAVATAIQSQAVNTLEDARTLRAALDRVEQETVLVDSDRIGTSVRWVRQRTATVNAEIKDRFAELLRDRVLDNPERGLATALRKSGYFQLALDRTRALIDPAMQNSLGAFDASIAEAESDAQQLRALKEAQRNELDVALRSLPAKLLGAREQVVKICLARLRDAEEQYLYTVAEKYLLVEARSATQELYRQMGLTRDALSSFLQKAETMRGRAQARLKTFQSRLDTGTHILFLQLFDAERDWPRFYKLGIDPLNLQPAAVNARAEYLNLLRDFEVEGGLAGLAEMLLRRTADEVNRKVEEFCDRRFYDDFVAHPRQVSVLDHPLLRDQAAGRQTRQNFVNHARPMLRRDEKMASSEVESTTFAYLGIAGRTAPESREFIDEIKGLMPPRCQFEVFETGKPNEIYLYFSTYAFPLPSVTLVQQDCHRAYTDFYSQFNPGQARKPATGIPLHLSERWEGRFDDLVVYSDREAEVLEEVLGIVNLAPSLRVLSLKPIEKTGLMEYFYKEAPPFDTLRSLGTRRSLTALLMMDARLRKVLTEEVQRREAQLAPPQLAAYFWALQAQYHHPDLEQDTPDSQLLRRKVGEVYRRATELRSKAPESMPSIDTAGMPASGKMAWIRTQQVNLRWEAVDQPVIEGLDEWKRS